MKAQVLLKSSKAVEHTVTLVRVLVSLNSSKVKLKLRAESRYPLFFEEQVEDTD